MTELDDDRLLRQNAEGCGGQGAGDQTEQQLRKLHFVSSRGTLFEIGQCPSCGSQYHKKNLPRILWKSAMLWKSAGANRA
jgi:hypothetical protein